MSTEASGSTSQRLDIESLKGFVHRAKEENIWLPRKPGSPRLVKIHDSSGDHLEFIPLRLKESAGREVSGRQVLNMKQIVDYCITNKISIIGLADCIYIYNKKKEKEPGKQIPDETIKEIWEIEKERIKDAAKTGQLEKLAGYQLSDSFLDLVQADTHAFLQIALENGQIAAAKDLITKLNIKNISLDALHAISRAQEEEDKDKLFDLVKDMPFITTFIQEIVKDFASITSAELKEKEKLIELLTALPSFRQAMTPLLNKAILDENLELLLLLQKHGIQNSDERSPLQETVSQGKETLANCLQKSLLIETAKTGDLGFLKGMRISADFCAKIGQDPKELLQLAIKNAHPPAVLYFIPRLDIKELTTADLLSVMSAPPEKQKELISNLRRIGNFNAIASQLMQTAINEKNETVLIFLQKFDLKNENKETALTAVKSLKDETLEKKLTLIEALKSSDITVQNVQDFIELPGGLDFIKDCVQFKELLIKEIEAEELAQQKFQSGEGVDEEELIASEQEDLEIEEEAISGAQLVKDDSTKVQGATDETQVAILREEPKTKKPVDQVTGIIKQALDAGNLELLLALHKEGITNSNGESPLHIMINLHTKTQNIQHLKVIKEIINKCSVQELIVLDAKQLTPLEIAFKSGNKAVTEQFIKKEGSESLLTYKNHADNTLLHLMCEELETVSSNALLLLQKLPLEALEIVNSAGKTALDLALLNHRKLTSELLQLKEERDEKNREGELDDQGRKIYRQKEASLYMKIEMLQNIITAHANKLVVSSTPLDLNSRVFQSLLLEVDLESESTAQEMYRFPGLKLEKRLKDSFEELLKKCTGTSKELFPQVHNFLESMQKIINLGLAKTEALQIAFALMQIIKEPISITKLKEFIFKFNPSAESEKQAFEILVEALKFELSKKKEAMTDNLVLLQKIVSFYEELTKNPIQQRNAFRLALFVEYDISRIDKLKLFIHKEEAGFKPYGGRGADAIPDTWQVFKENHDVYVLLPLGRGTFKTADLSTKIAKSRLHDIGKQAFLAARLTPNPETARSDILDFVKEIRIAKKNEGIGIVKYAEADHIPQGKDLDSAKKAVQILKTKGAFEQLGISLQSHMSTIQMERDPLKNLQSLRSRLSAFKEILIGMKRFHGNGYLWGDGKPDNVLITLDEQGRLHASMRDFGTSSNLKEGEKPYLSYDECFYASPGFSSLKLRIAREKLNKLIQQKDKVTITEAQFVKEKAKILKTINHKETDMWAAGTILKALINGKQFKWIDETDPLTVPVSTIQQGVKGEIDKPLASLRKEKEKGVMSEEKEASLLCYELLKGLMPSEGTESSWTAAEALSKTEAAIQKFDNLIEGLEKQQKPTDAVKQTERRFTVVPSKGEGLTAKIATIRSQEEPEPEPELPQRVKIRGRKIIIEKPPEHTPGGS
jgi:ankyrin repeat protein/serine/threonine protein kinase